jgi:hypothetical protein
VHTLFGSYGVTIEATVERHRKNED